LNRRLCGPQNQYARLGEEDLWPLPGFDTTYGPARSLVAIATAVFENYAYS